MSFLTYFFANSFISSSKSTLLATSFSTSIIESDICQSRQVKDYKLFLLIFF